jgi:predicted PurR-regulated permease PerM
VLSLPFIIVYILFNVTWSNYLVKVKNLSIKQRNRHLLLSVFLTYIACIIAIISTAKTIKQINSVNNQTALMVNEYQLKISQIKDEQQKIENDINIINSSINQANEVIKNIQNIQ